PRPTQADDGARGVRLYRANFIRCLFAPRERYAHAPVQTIVPLGDKYVSPALSENLSRWVPQYYRREVAAGHWLPLADPTRFAALAGQLIDAVESRNEPPALANARRRATSGRFSGKVAVVTGAGSGIGRCAALAFAREGATIVACDIDLASAERTALLIGLTGAQAHAKRVDVGSADEMEALATWVGSELGGADVVINNAGIGMAGGILDTSTRHWERILHVNLWGVIHGSRLFAQQMAARGSGGHIVNTASAAAFGPSRDLPAYATTKAAVLMLSECMRAELAEKGIGVTAVCPGFAETGIMASTQYAGANAQDEARLRKRATKLYQMRGLKPETVAQAMVDGVLRNRPVVAVGGEAHAMRFVGRFMPWLGQMIARVSMASH
ncbi:SDR family oxidoreductase, partial [Burkholderia sp. Tr-849]